MSSPISRKPAFEVFLSFRGPDTRNNFADFLFDKLINANIYVFRDEEEMESGEELNPQLIQAIEQSKISIPVISKKFAASNSCLMELEHMVDCMDRKNHTIIPIFYHVDPKNVRNSEGTFEEANENQKRALYRIGNLSGHHLVKSDKRPTKVIKRVVRKVRRKLKKEDLILPKQLVDVDPHVQDIMAKLKVDYHKGKAVKIGATCGKVLIYGIPGVGKTVLAKCVYNRLNHLYDACSFLEKIQEEIKRKSVLYVQNRLNFHLHKKYAQKFHSSDDALRQFRDRFHAMKILVLLDDVKDHEQLRLLVGELDWLHQRSTVIVTSRRDDVLQSVEGVERFGLRPMQEDKALQLFSWHAFKKDSPPKRFEKLSTEIVTATDRLPLALERAGKSLWNIKDRNVWTETPTALEQALEPSLQEAFLESYNTLKEIEQDIFLDIACFFIGQDQRIPYYMWDDCKFFPSTSFRSLRATSLVETGKDEELCMLGILKTFGREIVKNESKKVPRKRSRLCNHKEALDVLKRRKGTEKVEALELEFADGSAKDTLFKCDSFNGLWNLRFLKLDQADIRGNFQNHFSNLKWLDWRGCHKIFDVQSLNLNLQELLILDLSRSQVHKDWRGWDLLKQTRKLKVLNLTGCVHLIATPKFPFSMELERLILEGCSNLAVIHPSFGYLKKLVSLNMKGCNLLLDLPDLGPMTGLKELLIDRTSIRLIDFIEGSVRKLKILSARDCKDLNGIPNSIKYLKSLKFLTLDGSEILTLQESIESLEKLKTLSLKNCVRLSCLPDGIGKLKSLQSLDLSHTGIQNLPPSVKDLKAMIVLKMSNTFIHEFPGAVLNLEKLEEIDLSSCQRLEGRIDYDIGTLSSLAILKLSDTRISSLPPSISRLARLRELHILRCSNLQNPPELPPSVNVFRDLVN